MARKARTGQHAAQHERGSLARDTIAKHFHDACKRGFLNTLEREQPQAYCSLVSRVIPKQMEIAVEHHVIDLGAAMLEASARLERAQATLNMIDVTPATPATSDVTPATSDAAPATSDVERDTSDVERDTSDV